MARCVAAALARPAPAEFGGRRQTPLLLAAQRGDHGRARAARRRVHALDRACRPQLLRLGRTPDRGARPGGSRRPADRPRALRPAARIPVLVLCVVVGPAEDATAGGGAVPAARPLGQGIPSARRHRLRPPRARAGQPRRTVGERARRSHGLQPGADRQPDLRRAAAAIARRAARTRRRRRGHGRLVAGRPLCGGSLRGGRPAIRAGRPAQPLERSLRPRAQRVARTLRLRRAGADAA